MAFRFKLGEPFEDGCRRIAVDQVERAQSQLHNKGDEAVAVHETRKALKRLRSLLRLVRPAMGEGAYQRENTDLRELGLSLSGARDRHVLLETVSKLEASAPLGRKDLAASLRQAIAASNGESAPLTMKQALARLGEIKKRFGTLQIDGSGFDVVGAGLERSYRKACHALRAAYERQSDEAFHEWRKGAQQHWRQMTLLARAWPEYLAARANEARTLSQILGDDHDLALLVAFVHSEAAASLGGEQAAVIETAARQRQTKLRETAKPLGARLFADGPRRLRRNIRCYWEAAVALKEQELDAAVEPAAPTPSRTRRQSAPRRRPAPGSKA
jgi:CHAD domain-containing protein